MESNSESLNCSTLNVNGNENGENREKSIFNTQKESTWNMIGREFSTSIKTNEASSKIPGEFLQQDCLSNHGKEIGQENLKNALHSAICDLEIDLASKADLDNELPDLIHISQKETEIKTERLRLPHEFKARPLSEPSFTIPDTVEPMNLPEVGSNNYHNTKKEVSFKESKLETRSSTIENTFSSSQLSKILTPSSDDGSLKRRNPHQMYTDSAFYNPKHHPSVAEQVEMAHRLSSSLYDEGNKKSHGQEMFLKRAKKSDLSSDEEVFPLHDRVPNMKLVMNPEGKIHDWSDLPEDEIPDIKNRCALGTTAEVAQFVIENLEQCKGRGGELFAKRRKRADKWVVDESSVGTNKNPSDFAENFVKQVRLQESSREEKKVEMRDEQERKREVSQREQKTLPIVTERTETSDFQILEEIKFDSEEKKEKQSRCEISLPDGVAGCNLRSRAFTPTLDLSCHNTQGINVWATRAPKGFKVSWNDDCKASTLPRTTLKSVKGSFGDEKLPKFSNNNHNNESWSKYEEEKRQNEFYEQLEFESQEKSCGKLEEDSTSHRIQKKFDEEQSCMRESLKVPSVEIIPATPTIMETETDFCKTKKGGSNDENYFESYVNSLIPTTTGASIRQTGDIKPEFTTALMHEQLYKEQKRDREAFSQRSLKKTERLTSTSGVAKGSGSHSYEKHSVRNLVSRFSKVKREEVPLQYLPQHYRQNENAPPLSYLHEQARKRTFSFKEDTLTEPSSNVTQCVKQNNETNNQRRSSLKEYLYMNTEENVPVGQLLDPSSILRGDKSWKNETYNSSLPLSSTPPSLTSSSYNSTIFPNTRCSSPYKRSPHNKPPPPPPKTLRVPEHDVPENSFDSSSKYTDQVNYLSQQHKTELQNQPFDVEEEEAELSNIFQGSPRDYVSKARTYHRQTPEFNSLIKQRDENSTLEKKGLKSPKSLSLRNEKFSDVKSFSLTRREMEDMMKEISSPLPPLNPLPESLSTFLT